MECMGNGVHGEMECMGKWSAWGNGVHGGMECDEFETVEGNCVHADSHQTHKPGATTHMRLHVGSLPERARVLVCTRHGDSTMHGTRMASAM